VVDPASATTPKKIEVLAEPTEEPSTDAANASSIETPISVPRSSLGSSSSSAHLKRFVISGVSTDTRGIVLYHVLLPDEPRVLQRRFSEFKQLHSELKDVVIQSEDETRDGNTALPDLPYAGFLTRLKRNDPAMVNDRREKLEALLQAIAGQRAALHSPQFRKFITVDIK
jgi:hypothetical protein